MIYFQQIALKAMADFIKANKTKPMAVLIVKNGLLVNPMCKPCLKGYFPK